MGVGSSYRVKIEEVRKRERQRSRAGGSVCLIASIEAIPSMSGAGCVY